MNAKWFVLWLIPFALAASALAADDGLGQRTAFDLRWTDAAGWEHAKTLDLTLEKGKLTLVNHGSEPGWAAPAAPWMIVRDATLAFHLAEAKNAQVTLQVEWLAENGDLIGAMDAIDRANESDTRVEVKLADLMPKAAAGKPELALMRVKLWAGGDGGSAVIDELAIRGPRAFQNPKTKLVRALPGAGTMTKPDEGMKLDPISDGLTTRLESGKAFAGLVVGESVAFDEKTVTLLDVSWLSPKARVGLQAVCFGADGKYLASVDLLKEVARPGVYEVPVSIYKSAFPAGVSTIQMKLWLGGEKAVARIAGVWIGKLP